MLTVTPIVVTDFENLGPLEAGRDTVVGEHTCSVVLDAPREDGCDCGGDPLVVI